MKIIEIFNAYEKLLEGIQASSEQILLHDREHIKCSQGCYHCCQDISICFLEAVCIRTYLKNKNFSYTVKMENCGWLDESGLCKIYQVRPLICRTHGYIICSSQIPDGMDCCPLNYGEQDLRLFQSSTFQIDSINSFLITLEIEFLKHFPDLSRERIYLSEIPEFTYFDDFIDKNLPLFQIFGIHE